MFLVLFKISLQNENLIFTGEPVFAENYEEQDRLTGAQKQLLKFYSVQEHKAICKRKLQHMW